MSENTTSAIDPNSLSDDAFIARYGFLFEHSPWIVEAAAAHGLAARRQRLAARNVDLALAGRPRLAAAHDRELEAHGGGKARQVEAVVRPVGVAERRRAELVRLDALAVARVGARHRVAEQH